MAVTRLIDNLIYKSILTNAPITDLILDNEGHTCLAILSPIV